MLMFKIISIMLVVRLLLHNSRKYNIAVGKGSLLFEYKKRSHIMKCLVKR